MSHGEAVPVQTASATASALVVAEGDASGGCLGRYRIEHELGAGAIGVVHAAFDPDLKRRVALKVLRTASASREARERLLREARAMARLAHPNVVTVYEAGTVSGRDFIAMELIRGETLADWLRTSRRAPAAVLEAFVAAGRGLAAAHAAGIVHRDFKPRNVLRSRDGRVAVTDFGLARETDALAATLDDTLPAGAESLPDEQAQLTATGALLGTPAYMAPEQWRGEAVTPETDQFAYCVALWEALSGERPYRGRTFDELRRQSAAGPAALDASAIPRRLRSVLRRGLDPDPARRWPSMTALLAQLARTRRVRTVAAGVVGTAAATLAVAAAAAAVAHALRPGAAIAVCDPPAPDAAEVWSVDLAAALRARASDAHVAVFDAADRQWQIARVAVCRAAPQLRPAQLQCLDGVARRFDALRRAFARVPDAQAEEIQAQLVDPEVCRAPVVERVPRLAVAPTDDVVAAYALFARSATAAPPSRAELAALAGTSTDACARVIATLAFDAAFPATDQARALTAEVEGAADQCGDERLRAELRIERSRFEWELPVIGPRGEAAIANARIAAARVMQPELDAAVKLQELVLARQRQQWGLAFRLADAALADYRARGLELRQLRTVVTRNDLRLARSEPDDLAAIAGDVARWRPIAVRRRQADLLRRLDALDGAARFWRGDVATAHAELLPLVPDGRTGGSRRITGEVVDELGRPVAGAQVAAASSLFADSAGIGLRAFVLGDRYFDDLRIATSGADGRFAIEGGASSGSIAAQQGDRRSRPVWIADHVVLALEPTRTVIGKIDLAGTAYTHVRVDCVASDAPSGMLATIAPVGEDGSFVVRGASVGPLHVSAIVGSESNVRIESRTVPGSRSTATVRIDLAARPHAIDVVIGSAVVPPLGGAVVAAFAGGPRIANVRDILRLPMVGSGFAKPVGRGDIPAAVRGRVESGDLVAHVEYSGRDDLTICAVNVSGDWIDPAFRRHWFARVSDLPFACTHVVAGTAVAALRLPAQRRME